VYIPVLVLGALVIGAALGAWRAKRRGGKALDMAQYAAAHAIPLMILALFITIFLDRAGK
jgi:peptidoglycan/LPS O-acetylase OafA/YrhL